jgi:hypothetical protein
MTGLCVNASFLWRMYDFLFLFVPFPHYVHPVYAAVCCPDRDRKVRKRKEEDKTSLETIMLKAFLLLLVLLFYVVLLITASYI